MGKGDYATYEKFKGRIGMQVMQIKDPTPPSPPSSPSPHLFSLTIFSGAADQGHVGRGGPAQEGAGVAAQPAPWGARRRQDRGRPSGRPLGLQAEGGARQQRSAVSVNRGCAGARRGEEDGSVCRRCLRQHDAVQRIRRSSGAHAGDHADDHGRWAT